MFPVLVLRPKQPRIGCDEDLEGIQRGLERRSVKASRRISNAGQLNFACRYVIAAKKRCRDSNKTRLDHKLSLLYTAGCCAISASIDS